MSSDFKITLLGTGNPSPRLDRFGPSTLIEAAGQKILFDCGRGTMQRAYQVHKQTRDYDKLFLTHLHSDHTTGIPDLWITGTLMGRHDRPLRVWGPQGTRSMMRYLEKAFAGDLKVRRMGESFHGIDHRGGIAVEAFDIDEGFVFEEDGVTVEPFRVNHYSVFSDEPSFGYRVRYDGRSIVLSGDTRFCENLIKYSSEVDLLIHEVAAAPLGSDHPNNIRYFLSLHTQPEECGRLFSRVNPRLAVYTHVIQYLGVSLEARARVVLVDLALLQSVSYIAGALGVCVAAAYYVYNMRTNQKTMKTTLETRQAQLLMQIYDRVNNRNFTSSRELSSSASWNISPLLAPRARAPIANNA